VGSADGNPLFLEELLAMLVDQAVLRRVGGRWTTGELPALAIPPTIQALIAARLDRLPDPERFALELASIQGTVFDGDAVVELAPEPGGGVQEALAALVRKELIRPRPHEQGAFFFRHELVRDVAYDSIPKRARAELHERLARRLAERTALHAPEPDDRAGYHLGRARLLRNELAADVGRHARGGGLGQPSRATP
jgi:predicted ATPase